MLKNRAADGWRKRLRGVGRSCGSWCSRALFLSLVTLLGGTSGFLALGCRCSAFLDHCQHGTDLNRVAHGNLEFGDDASDGRGGLDRDLVGFEADDGFVDRPGSAELAQPPEPTT